MNSPICVSRRKIARSGDLWSSSFLLSIVVVKAGLLRAEGTHQVLPGGTVATHLCTEAGGNIEELAFPRCYSLGHLTARVAIYLPFNAIILAFLQASVKREKL
jgi:hypothetical protein